MSKTIYRQLKMGEIVQQGDEVLHESRGWIPAKGGIGREAPDPRFPAHCVYRRPDEFTLIEKILSLPNGGIIHFKHQGEMKATVLTTNDLKQVANRNLAMDMRETGRKIDEMGRAGHFDK
jgi:hypothetical protein